MRLCPSLACFQCIYLYYSCLAIEKKTTVKAQPIDGKAHAAMFDPLKTVKNEADTTYDTKEAKGDPFAEIGKSR